MTTPLYCRSTDGNDADNGTTWALAKATLGAGIAAIDSPGDQVYVSQVHAESTAGSITHPFAGTVASPVKIYCGNDAAEPPTAGATTATITTTSATASITFTGLAYEIYGIAFISGSGGSGNNVISPCATSNGLATFQKCSFQLPTTGTSAAIRFEGSNSKVVWRDCDVKFGATAQSLQPFAVIQFIWEGGSILAGSAAITSLFNFLANGERVEVNGVDLSAGAAGMNLVSAAGQNSKFVFRNCKLPGSWSGSVSSVTPGANSEIAMYNCDSSGTNYRLWIKNQFGEVKHETTIVKTSGATDGTTPLSWKMASGVDAEFPHLTLSSPEIVKWNDTTTSVTVTVDCVYDSVTNLKDTEVWLEVMYLSASGTPIGTYISDFVTDPVSAAADQTSSSATWTTTGITNVNKFQVNVTFTPGMKGFIHARVKLAKASTTIYVDPLLTLT